MHINKNLSVATKNKPTNQSDKSVYTKNCTSKNISIGAEEVDSKINTTGPEVQQPFFYVWKRQKDNNFGHLSGEKSKQIHQNKECW